MEHREVSMLLLVRRSYLKIFKKSIYRCLTVKKIWKEKRVPGKIFSFLH